MSGSITLIPDIDVGVIVVTPSKIKNITINKKYVVQKVGDREIFIVNDIGELHSYNAYRFMEADLYFTMCLFSTLIMVFKLGEKAYK